MAAERCVLTYNGVDGACAAASVLLKHPEAEVRITSASRVGRTLRELSEAPETPRELHICGLGVWCDWEEVMEPATEMAEDGVSIYWYCGRGYLEEDRKRFESFCQPVFMELDTNTGAVCEFLNADREGAADRLRGLARHDSHNETLSERPAPSEAQQWWKDFIEASVSQYFKYQDVETYERAIRRLAENRVEHRDERLVEVFRQKGNRYILRGKSGAMRNLRERIRQCAEADEDVLITGESGVGKEYVAHLLHERSSRAMEPIIPVNCAVFAGNEGLANSKLFGHRKGAFTGASRDRDGAFVTADSGILFLDEVGELPMQVQAKFLRVLEDGWITPEGADRPQRRVDVRVIAATKRNLAEMVQEKTFRDDLYHRLDTLRIHVPPLREHAEDIPEIVDHTVEELDEEELSSSELQALTNYFWPGNVRQLIKVLKRTAYLDIGISEALEEEGRLGADVQERRFLPQSPDDIQSIDRVKSRYSKHALQLNGGNKSDTARRLDISPNTLKAYLEG